MHFFCERILYMIFPVFTTIVVLGIIFKIFMHRSNRNIDPDKEFFEREARANLTPRKPVEDLPYILVDVSALPLDISCGKEEVTDLQNSIRSLADKKILNLTGMSNTDLKLEYGAPNINFLSACDTRFTTLARSIASLAEYYYNSDHIREAEILLQYGINIGTDVKKNYTLLAECYIKKDRSCADSKIEALKEKASALNSLSKEPILNALDDILDKTK